MELSVFQEDDEKKMQTSKQTFIMPEELQHHGYDVLEFAYVQEGELIFAIFYHHESRPYTRYGSLTFEEGKDAVLEYLDDMEELYTPNRKLQRLDSSFLVRRR